MTGAGLSCYVIYMTNDANNTEATMNEAWAGLMDDLHSEALLEDAMRDGRVSNDVPGDYNFYADDAEWDHEFDDPFEV